MRLNGRLLTPHLAISILRSMQEMLCSKWPSILWMSPSSPYAAAEAPGSLRSWLITRRFSKQT